MEWSVKLLCFIATVRVNLDFWRRSYGPRSPSQLVLWCRCCRSLKWRGTWARLPERGRKRNGGEWLPFVELTSAPPAGGEHCESASHTESHHWPDRWGFSVLMLHPRGAWLENWTFAKRDTSWTNCTDMDRQKLPCCVQRLLRTNVQTSLVFFLSSLQTDNSTFACLTLCLSWTRRMTERARAVTEGNTAIHVDSRAVSHTTGLAKAFSNTPEEKQTGITKMFHYSAVLLMWYHN